MNNKIKIELDSADFQAALNEITESAAKFPLEVRELLFDRLNVAPELAVFKSDFTKRTGGVIRLEPSEFLFDLLAASRTGDFDNFLVKHSHNEPPLIQ